MIVSVASHHRRRVVATLAALTNSDNITVSAPHRCNSTNDEVNHIISTDSWSGEPREIKQHSNIDRSNSIAAVQHHFWNNWQSRATVTLHDIALVVSTRRVSTTQLTAPPLGARTTVPSSAKTLGLFYHKLSIQFHLLKYSNTTSTRLVILPIVMIAQ